MTTNVTEETLRLIGEAQKNPLVDADINRAFTQSSGATTGLTFYDLEPAAKLLFPVLTPLRNKIPRVSGKGGIQANWKAITAINPAGIRAGVSEGNRGAVIGQTLTEYLAAYRGIGLENYSTFEADLAAQGFDDAKALAVQLLLKALMIQEEALLLAGNTSVALGTTPTPTTATATTGGTITAATWSIICVALTQDGYANNSVALGLTASITKTNSDASSDTFGGGVAQKSAAASQVTTGATSTISASVAPLPGAIAYAWYAGPSGTERLQVITTINSVLFTAPFGTTAQLASVLPSSDQSTNALVFDGLYAQCFKSGSGAYVGTMATGTPGTGSTLTSDGAGGVVEIETALLSFWNNYRLAPDIMYVSAQEQANITKKIIGAGAASTIRYDTDVQGGNAIAGGFVAKSYLSKVLGKSIQIVVHPNAVPGTILFYSDGIPYPLNGVGNILQVKCRRDYYQIEWPLRSRKYEYGVYADQVLQNYFPPAFGLLTNIANG